MSTEFLARHSGYARPGHDAFASIGRVSTLLRARLSWIADLALPARSGPAAPADDLARLADIVRLYRIALDTVPDRPGLLHHAELLASGHTLADLAASMLPGPGGAGIGGRYAGCAPVDIAASLWSRDGRAMAEFGAAWSRASGLADFVAALVRRPSPHGATMLAALFPDGVDPLQGDVYPAWGYRLWSLENERVLSDRARRLLPLLRLAAPRIVLTLRVDARTGSHDLDATLSSLASQIYGRWSLQLTGSLPPGCTLPRDPRIGRRDEAGRSGLQGSLAPGDTLSPACLALFAFAALRRPGVARWSCDLDRRSPDGYCHAPQLDPERRDGLALTRRGAAETARSTRHLPAVLLHRAASIVSAVPPTLPDPTLPSISVVIATRDKPALLARCIASLERTTADLRPQIVLVDNGSTDPEALALLESLRARGCTLLRRPGAFNWSLLNNAGVRASSGEVVVLLNNDVECIAPDWLGTLVRACLDPSVGTAGAELRYPDGTVQHAGVFVGPGPKAAHRWSDGSETGIRSVSAVTGACMAFRRAVFDRLGGLDEALPVTWNDLDFCLRARAAGFDIRLASNAVLRHDELGTRTPDSAPENQAQLARTRAHVDRRHRRALRRDPFLHPLALMEGGGRLLDPLASRRIWRLIRCGGAI